MWHFGLAAGVVAAHACAAGSAPQGPTDFIASIARWFASGELPSLRLHLEPDDADLLRQKPREYARATLTETGAVPIVVGVKLKGSAGSFRELDDRPGFTVAVDRFDRDGRFHGLAKFYLNNAVQDPSCLREYLAYELFRRAGLPAPLVTHAVLAIDDRVLGLYVLKEGYDRHFLERSFGTAAGNLYDGGTNRDVGDELERDAGDGPLDRADLQALARACAESDPKLRQELLADRLDVEQFLAFMALELMIDHWDGYTRNPNNFRVWLGPTGKAVFIPHGTDQTFQNVGQSIFAPVSGTVARVVMSDRELRRAWLQRVRSLLPLFSPPDAIFACLRERLQRIRPVVERIAGGDAGRVLAAAEQELEQIVAARALFLASEFERPEPVPLEVGGRGASLAGCTWGQQVDDDDAVLDQVGEGADRRLVITAGNSGHCVASWRTKVMLARGSYEFRARMTASGVVPLEHEDNAGAGVRISGRQRSDVFAGSADDREVAFAFDVEEDLRDVVLVVELRAVRGRVAFPLSSLVLFRR